MLLDNQLVIFQFDTELDFAILGLIIGIFVGIPLTAYLQDHLRKYFSSNRTIRERLKMGKPISIIEEKRILEFAKARHNDWVRMFKSPSKESKEEAFYKYVPLPYDATIETTKCPSSEKFLFLESTIFLDPKNQTDNGVEIIEKLNSYLKNKDEDGITKKLFKNSYLSELIEGKTVWIRVPTYTFTNYANLNEFYKKIQSLTYSWLKGSKLVIELFIPTFIVENYPKLFYPQSNNLVSSFQSENFEFYYGAGKTIFLNDYANYILNKKCLFGKLEIENNKRIPKSLIDEKVQDISFENKNQIIEITGPPGSGKTDTLKYLIEEKIAETDNCAVVCFNSHEDLSFLKRNEKGQKISYLDFTKSLLDFLDLSEIFEYDDIELLKKPVLEILNKRKVNIILVIDNLEYTENLYSEIEDLLSSNRFRNVSLLAASRCIFEYKESNVNKIPIERKHWTYQESIKIIEYWNNNAESLTNKSWLETISMSTYFLRVISSSSDNYEPDILIRNEIDLILSPLLKNSIYTKRNSNEKIVLIEQLLKKQKITQNSIKQILNSEKKLDLISAFGDLTMNTIYNHNYSYNKDISTIIDADKLLSFGHFNEKESANNFIKECEKAGIIKGNHLTDKLLQDGTAAIMIQNGLLSEYLQISDKPDKNEYDSKQQTEIEGIIYKIIISLSKKNSLEIFKLSFNIRHLIAIIRSIINSKRDKNILAELLTIDYIKYISRDLRNVETIAWDLIVNFNNNEFELEDKIIIGLCLSRIIDTDNKTKDLLNERLRNNHDIELVCSTYANYYLNDFVVFNLIEGHSCQVSLIRYCCEIWDSKAGIEFLNVYLELRKNILFDENYSNFMKWIKKQKTHEIIQFCDQSMLLLQSKDNHDKEIITKIIIKVFGYLFGERFTDRIITSAHLESLHKWKEKIKKLIFRKIISNKVDIHDLIEVLAFGYDRRLSIYNTENEYSIVSDPSKNTISAIPIKQFRTEGFKPIYSKFKDTSQFDLPSSKLLERVYRVSRDGKELVNDYMKSNNKIYYPFPIMLPNEYKYYFDHKIFGLEREDIIKVINEKGDEVTNTKDKYGWRAVFII